MIKLATRSFLISMITASAMALAPWRSPAVANNAPVCLKQLGTMNLTTASAPCMWPLDDLFSDDGQIQACTYTCYSSSSSVFIADIPTINGVNYFRIRCMGVGSGWGYLRAYDGQYKTTMNFNVSVAAPPNACPTLTANLTNRFQYTDASGTVHQDFVHLKPGNSTRKGFNSMFVDAENDPLTPSPSPTVGNSNIATVSAIPIGFGQFTIQVTAGNQFGTTTGTVFANDNQTHTDGCTNPAVYNFTIQTVAETIPHVSNPFSSCSGLPNTLVQKRGANVNYDLNKVFNDDDGDFLTYGIVNAGDSSLADVGLGINGVSRNLLVINTKMVSGTTSITVSATDSVAGHSPINYTFTLAVDQAPVPSATNHIGNAGNGIVSLDLQASDYTTPLAQVGGNLIPVYFSDPENEQLSYSISAPPNFSIATAGIANSVSPQYPYLVISPKGVGNTTATLRATDPFCNFAEIPITIKIHAGAAPQIQNHINPDDFLVLKTTSPTSIYILEYNANTDPEGIFLDPEGNPMTFCSSGSLSCSVSSDPTIAAVTAFKSCPTGCKWVLTVTPKDKAGTITANVIADDGNNNQTAYMFNVQVTAGERPTVQTPFSPVNLTVGGPDAYYMLSSIFSDPEGGALTYALNKSGLDESIASIDPFPYTLPVSPQVDYLRITPVSVGSTSAVIMATDPDQNTTSYLFTVNVTQSDDEESAQSLTAKIDIRPLPNQSGNRTLLNLNPRCVPPWRLWMPVKDREAGDRTLLFGPAEN